MKKEWIFKSLSEKQNHRASRPSLDDRTNVDEEHQHRNKSTPEGSHTQRIDGNIDNNEEESYNVFYQMRMKKPKLKLQGGFRKIKCPTFDGEVEEVVEPWIMNMNKYFQVYEYDNNLKAKLNIYQHYGKATLCGRK